MDSNSKTFRQWISEPESLLALSAVAIAVCSFGTSVYQSWLTREHNRKSVEPHITVQESYQTDHLFSVNVSNKGFGPAKIEEFAIIVDGQQEASWAAAMEKLLGEPLNANPFGTSLLGGMVLSPGDTELVFYAGGGQINNIHKGFNEGVLIRIRYSSIYDECWEVSRKSGQSKYKQIR